MARSLLLLAVVLVAGCSLSPGGRLWHTSLPNGEAEPLPVVLRDETRLVSGIEPALVDTSDAPPLPALRADPSDPSVLVVSWLGGCDTDAELALQPSHRASPPYELHVSPRSSGGLISGCAPIAVGRGVRIHTISPIPVSSIVVNGVTP
jgi:hypothetical protein